MSETRPAPSGRVSCRPRIRELVTFAGHLDVSIYGGVYVRYGFDFAARDYVDPVGYGHDDWMGSDVY